MDKTVTLNCANCSKDFEKSTKEYIRQIKKGNNRFFCTGSCAAIKINSEIIRSGNPQFLISDNKRDEYTPFRWFILRAQSRNKKKNYGCDITAEYIKKLWEEQKGICPFTGWKLILPKSTSGWENNNPANASIDRIDNSFGYTQGNVRFVSVMANLARQLFTDDQVFEFCKATVNHFFLPKNLEKKPPIPDAAVGAGAGAGLDCIESKMT